MVWYYVKNGQHAGPIEEAAFDELVRNGAVSPETLIWNSTMTAWAPCSQAYRAGSQPMPVSSPMSGSTCTCRECGRQFSDDQVVPLADGFVCAACKPMALRKMQEGVVSNTGGNYEYAGFWIRLAAKFIDGCAFGLVVGIVVLVPMFVLIGASSKSGQSMEAVLTGIMLLCQLLCYFAIIAYDTFFIGRYGATLGKMAVGIKVIRVDNSRITYMRAFGRACANLLSGICYIGYIIAAFDDEKRSLHDHICDTRVVYK
jgi:uncharacterized RDD family membrane protein YckC